MFSPVAQLANVPILKLVVLPATTVDVVISKRCHCVVTVMALRPLFALAVLSQTLKLKGTLLPVSDFSQTEKVWGELAAIVRA
jgi:hypothetical protein